MTVLAEDLITFISGTTTVTGIVGTRIHYNKIPEHSERPHVWLQTAADEEERTLDTTGGLHEARVDIECVAEDESTGQSLADAVKDRLDGYRGTMGNIRAQGIFLEDKDDSYFPKTIDADDGAHLVAYDARIFYST